LQHRLQSGLLLTTQQRHNRLQALQTALPLALRRSMEVQQQRLQRGQTALGLLDPQLVLQRGYAFLTDEHGVALTRAAQARPGQPLRATLADGHLGLRVES
jgi:exodeoxyribonuclease VII large subunit